LDQLAEHEELPRGLPLHRLSGLGPSEVEEVRRAWPQLAAKLRRQLMARLVQMAEADFEMDFGAISRLAMTDADADVRCSAIECLWEDEDVRLVPPLAQRLREDEAEAVRAAAATSLGRFLLLGELKKIRPKPYSRAYEALLTACCAAGETMEVRRRALESLAYVSNEKIEDLIEEAYRAEAEEMRISAVFAMGRSADDRWAREVKQVIFSPNPALRYEAARACGELMISESTSDLIELTEDVDLEVQQAALWSLGQLGGDKSRVVLERFCASENAALRAAAEAALNQLKFLHGDLDELFTWLALDPEG
jgi:HEAT repeat protein